MTSMSEEKQCQWFIARDGKAVGPFLTLEILTMYGAALLTDDTHLLKEGEAEWTPLRKTEIAALRDTRLPASKAVQPTTQDDSAAEGVWSKIAGKVGDAAGLERLEGFSIRYMFSEAFRRHSAEETEAHFIVGTQSTTPPLNEVSTSWPTPWAFIRLMGASLLAAIGFYWAIGRFENPKLYPGWLFMGCFALPFSMLVFFFETNVLRNVSFYRVTTLLFAGGLLSLIVSLTLFDITSLASVFGPMAAGPIEELGKLLAVVFFTRSWRQYGWILNGILFGAAVGTGFSAFESAGYVFSALSSGTDFASEITMIERSFLSPFTHTIWTAAAAGALWRVKREQGFAWPMLVDWRFLRVFLMIIALHAAWNSPITIPGLGETLGFFASRLFLGLVGWIIVLLLIQSGLKQVSEAKEMPKLNENEL